MSKLIDMTGQVFGRLTVIERAENDKRGQARWLCECSCKDKTRKIVLGSHLRNGKTQSCGCLHRENLGNIRRKHGKSGTKIYIAWKNMKSRCCNPKNEQEYKNYGGRGIKVCDEWLNDANSFIEWSFKNGYDDNLTIDRVDVNGDYCPENCRWVDTSIQSNNKRNNHYIEIDGERHTMKEWCDIYNQPPGLVRDRINVLKWEAKDALTIPKGQRRRVS